MPTATSTRLARETLRWLPRKGISRAFGRVAAAQPPRPLLDRAIELYVKAYGVDLSECVVPDGGFASFNEFFARPLRPDARPLDPDPSALLSPADGKLEAEGPVEPDATLRIKGRPYSLEELLGGRREVDALAGGRFAVVYLSPRDYHRVHAPSDGLVTHARHIGGTLYPVNRIGLDHVEKLFATNERVVVSQSTASGPVVTLLVGALIVGGIRLAFDSRVASNRGLPAGELRYDDPPHLARGAELGRFVLGSTAIVFVGPKTPVTAVVREGASVRMGQALYRGRA